MPLDESCLHCGFAADHFNPAVPFSRERSVIRVGQHRPLHPHKISSPFPLPNRTVDQIVDVSISQPRRNLEVFSVVSDALISPDWSRPIHCTGRHHALVMGPCIWVLISYIRQSRQSHAHASSTTKSILSYYSSEIPSVLSTSDEMSITQMRRTLVYGPPGVES